MFEALQQEQPIGEIRVNQNVQIVELNQEGSVSDPGQCDLTRVQSRENGFLVLTFAPREQNLPNHFIKKLTRVKGLGGCQRLPRSFKDLTPTKAFNPFHKKIDSG